MEEKDENVVEETTQDQVEQTPVEETPQIDESKFESAGDDSVIKVDLTKKPEENAVPEQSTDEVPVRNESETSEEVLEENVEETDEKPTGEEVSDTVQDEQPVLEEVT